MTTQIDQKDLKLIIEAVLRDCLYHGDALAMIPDYCKYCEEPQYDENKPVHTDDCPVKIANSYKKLFDKQ